MSTSNTKPITPDEHILREASLKIEAILKEYDLAGMAALQSSTGGCALKQIFPSWACLEHDGNDTLTVKTNMDDDRVNSTRIMILNFINRFTEFGLGLIYVAGAVEDIYPLEEKCPKIGRN